MIQPIEIWKPVSGYEGLYEVSNTGFVRRASASRRAPSGRMVKSRPNAGGYLRVCLYRAGAQKDHFVHHLVLEAFVGSRPEGMEGCHSPDRNPANNDATNLRWDTKSENQYDRVRHGTHQAANRTHCPQGHEYAGANLILTKRGWRKCRECHRVRSAQRHAKSRAAFTAGQEDKL